MTSDDAPTTVLFVCYANVCRSPLAEGLFRHLVAKRGLETSFRIDSAGTNAMEGAPPHPLSQTVADQHGFSLGGISRQILRRDLSEFDHVLLMDRLNRADLTRMAAPSAFGPLDGYRANIRLLMEVADPDAEEAELDVPDPIGGEEDRYHVVYELLVRGCTALLDELAPAP